MKYYGFVYDHMIVANDCFDCDRDYNIYYIDCGEDKDSEYFYITEFCAPSKEEYYNKIFKRIKEDVPSEKADAKIHFFIAKHIKILNEEEILLKDIIK